MTRRKRSDTGSGRAVSRDSGPVGIAGWLLLFCLLLLIWQPISLALVASSALDALPVRGAPLALALLLRLLAVALGIAAGLALLARRASAPAMAKVSLGASATIDAFVYSTAFLPNNRLPGETELVLAGSLAYYAIWFAYLFASKRVRNTFGS
jgi:Protein of unknown function (DUF2569)